MPHPLETQVVLKIQTNGQSTPVQALQEACRDLIVTLSKMKSAFTTEVLRAKATEGEDDDQAMDGEDGGY